MGCIQSKVACLSAHEAEEKPPRRRSGSRKATFKGGKRTVFGRRSKAVSHISLQDEDDADSTPYVPTMPTDGGRQLQRQFSKPVWQFGESWESDQDQDQDSEDEDLYSCVLVHALVHPEPAFCQATKDDGDGAHDTTSAMELEPPSQPSPLTVGEEESNQQSQASDLDEDSAHNAESCPELHRACHSSISLTEEWEDTQSCPEFPKPCHYTTSQLTDGCGDGAHDTASAMELEPPSQPSPLTVGEEKESDQQSQDGAHTDINLTAQTEGTGRSPVTMSNILVHVEDQSDGDIDDDDYSADVESNGPVDDNALTDRDCEVDQATENAETTINTNGEDSLSLMNDTPTDVEVTSPASQTDLDEIDIDLWPSLLFILWSTQNMAICAVLCLVWDHTVRALNTRLRATAKLTGDGIALAGCPGRCRCHYVEMDPDTPSTSYPRNLDDHCIVWNPPSDNDSDDFDSDSDDDDEEDASSEVVSFEDYARYVAEGQKNTPIRVGDAQMPEISATEQTVDQPTEHAQTTTNASSEYIPSLMNDTRTDVEVTSPSSQADLDEIHIDLWPTLLFILWSTQNMAICAVLCLVWDYTVRALNTRLRATANHVRGEATSANFLTNEGTDVCVSGSGEVTQETDKLNAEDGGEDLRPTSPAELITNVRSKDDIW